MTNLKNQKIIDVENQIDALDQCLVNNTKSVKFNDKEITYKSNAEILEARTLLVHKLRVLKKNNENRVIYHDPR